MNEEYNSYNLTKQSYPQILLDGRQNNQQPDNNHLQMQNNNLLQNLLSNKGDINSNLLSAITSIFTSNNGQNSANLLSDILKNNLTTSIGNTSNTNLKKIEKFKKIKDL